MKGKQMSMKTKQITGYALIFIVIVAIALIVLNTPKENSIKRILEKTDVEVGEVISVTLDVSVKNRKTYYALEEYVPIGWEVVDDAGGATIDPNKLIWVIIQDAKDATYTYKIKAPSNSGDYTSSGIYMFDDSLEPKVISGDSVIKVSS